MKVQKKSFTLIELIVVIAVVGVLAGFIFVSLQGSRNAANDAKRKSDISNLYTSILGKGTEQGSYPELAVDIKPDNIPLDLQTYISQFLKTTPTDPTGVKPYFYLSDGSDFAVGAILDDGNCFVKATNPSIFSDTNCASFIESGMGLVQNFMVLHNGVSYNLSWTIPSSLSALPPSQVSTAIICLENETELTSFPSDEEILSSGQLVAIASNDTTIYRYTPSNPEYYTYCKAISYDTTVITNPGIPDPDDPNNHPNTSSGGFASSSYEVSTPTTYEQEEASNPPDLNSGTGTGGSTSSNFVLGESRNLDGTGTITLSFIPGNLSTHTLIRRVEGTTADMNIAPALITDGVEIYNKENNKDANDNYLDPTVEHIVTDSNLNASKYYCYSAWAYVINPDNSKTYSNGFVLACGSVPLSSITDLNLTSTTNSFNLSFTKGSGDFTIIRRTETNPAADLNQGILVYNSTGTSITDSDASLAKNTSYCYTLWSYNTDLQTTSESSASVCDTLKNIGNPSNLTATNVTQNAITLNWTLGAGSTKSWIKRVASTTPSTEKTGGEAFTGATKTDTGLAPDTDYCYSIWAYDETTSSYSDNYVSVCSKTLLPVNGSCGTAVRTFAYDETSYGSYTQCATGTSSNTSFPAQGGSMTWTCSGVNGGSASSDCTASRNSGSIDGTCGTAVRVFAYDETSYGSYTQCATGTPSNTNFPAQGSSEAWTCSGQNGGNDSSSCVATRDGPSISGVCGTANKTFYATVTSYGTATFCSSGSLSATPSFPAIGGSSSWSCNGSNGGTTASCSASRVASACISGGGLTCSETVSGAYTINKYVLSGTVTGTKTWTVPANINKVDVLVVGGGGGGGGNYDTGGGGGGAGGLIYNQNYGVNSSQGYTVTVGVGGEASSNGANSVFNNLIAVGGGYGGHNSSNYGGSGGSGGGGRWNGAIGYGTSGQGNNGGSGSMSNPYAVGGGGGAGGVGGSASGVYSGAGGVGLAISITGTSTYYAGGGGGSAYNYGGAVAGTGGLGGGGNGSKTVGGAGTNGLGGGGGGAANGNAGGKGGSGVVIIKFLP